MKKTRTMRMAAVLFALVLITSCFVGNTFAKYVASDEATDTARVAKFGVTIEADTTADDMFLTEYETHDTVYGGTYSVDTSTDDKLVAPGTAGSFGGFIVTGEPEVAVRIAYTLDEMELLNWEVTEGSSTVFYCPIVFTVGSDEVDGTDYDSADSLIEALTETIAAYSEDYDPNTDLSSIADLSISWEWLFETGDDDDAIAANDIKDTALGDAAAAGNEPTISMKVSCTVTQID